MRIRPHAGIVAALALGALAIASSPSFALNPPYDALTLSCVGGGTNFAIIDVKAGATGAPAGFSLQWMSLAAWEANGNAWYDSDDPRLCKQSFSGQPSFTGNTTTRWELGPNGDVMIQVGDLIYDETGASGSLSDPVDPNCELKCGTDYVFRAFAHASRFNSRSSFSFISITGSPNLVEPGEVCGTSSDCGGCTLTQGYWRNHGPGDCHSGNNDDMWAESAWPLGVPTVPGGGPAVPVLALGTVNYSASQICAILKKPAGGNGLLALAHQLIAAKLNSLVNGVSCDQADIDAADALIGGKVVPPVGSATLKPSATSSLVGALDNFNNGLGCASHCTAPRTGAQPTRSVRWGQIKVRYR
jgi:hypothetical protein